MLQSFEVARKIELSYHRSRIFQTIEALGLREVLQKEGVWSVPHWERRSVCPLPFWALAHPRASCIFWLRWERKQTCNQVLYTQSLWCGHMTRALCFPAVLPGEPWLNSWVLASVYYILCWDSSVLIQMLGRSEAVTTLPSVSLLGGGGGGRCWGSFIRGLWMQVESQHLGWNSFSAKFFSSWISVFLQVHVSFGSLVFLRLLPL